MHKSLYLCLAVFCCLLSCRKDRLRLKKVQQLDSHTTNKINRIRFIGDNICILGGGVHFLSADIIRSADGGYTWAANNYPEAGKGMYGACIAPNGHVYLSGTDGTVLHSADSGATWQFNRILDWDYYVGIAYPTTDTGLYVSTHFNDLGSITKVNTAFRIVSKHVYRFGLNDIRMVSPTTGYVLGYGAILKTTDGGLTWNYLNVVNDNFTGMDIHGNELWVCGFRGGLFHSTDAGTTWEILRKGAQVGNIDYEMWGIVFKDKKKGWAVCDNGKLISTDDGGHHWMEYEPFTTLALRSISLCPNGDLLVAGDGGMLFRVTP